MMQPPPNGRRIVPMFVLGSHLRLKLREIQGELAIKDRDNRNFEIIWD